MHHGGGEGPGRVKYLGKVYEYEFGVAHVGKVLLSRSTLVDQDKQVSIICIDLDATVGLGGVW